MKHITLLIISVFLSGFLLAASPATAALAVDAAPDSHAVALAAAPDSHAVALAAAPDSHAGTLAAAPATDAGAGAAQDNIPFDASNSFNIIAAIVALCLFALIYVTRRRPWRKDRRETWHQWEADESRKKPRK